MLKAKGWGRISKKLWKGEEMTPPKIRCHRQRRDLQKIITKQYNTTVWPRRGQIAKIMEWVPEGMGKVIFIGQVNETKGKENWGISKSLRGPRDPSKKQWDESRCAEEQREAEGGGGELWPQDADACGAPLHSAVLGPCVNYSLSPCLFSLIGTMIISNNKIPQSYCLTCDSALYNHCILRKTDQELRSPDPQPSDCLSDPSLKPWPSCVLFQQDDTHQVYYTIVSTLVYVWNFPNLKVQNYLIF